MKNLQIKNISALSKENIFRIEIIFFQAKYKNEKFTNKKYVSALSKENIFRENTYTAVMVKIFHLVVRFRTVKT